MSLAQGLSISAAISALWENLAAEEQANARVQMWQAKSIVSLADFQSSYDLQRATLKCPVTEMVLNNLKTLPFIHLAADILKWHAVVFEVR